ncbi:lrr receptor-like serine/threonine-protein kinase [Quercus suber]|uniref:Lrr receptor-like serine/threonine-protein kinase n=1 Tax=Quercus suber TaxID=58331 RepID=A0AAW0IMD3_QUESU
MPLNPWNTLFSFLTIILPLLNPFVAFAVNPQGETLLSWKQSLNGPAEALSNWNPTDEAPCVWLGITCNINKEVVELELRHLSLYGTVPTNLSSLVSLTKVVLSSTNLTGSVPREIAILHELNYLDLSDNALTGAIPSEICNLLKLQEIHLPKEIFPKESFIGDNKLTGPIPREIGNLENLHILGLDLNRISGNVPAEIFGCRNLEYLNLHSNLITGNFPGATPLPC